MRLYFQIFIQFTFFEGAKKKCCDLRNSVCKFRKSVK